MLNVSFQGKDIDVCPVSENIEAFRGENISIKNGKS
jgi:hypothetical protein